MKIFEMLIPLTWEGLKVTMSVFAITLIVSLPLAIFVALLKGSRNKYINKFTSAYIYVMRGTPLLLQLMFIFFGFHYIPVIGYAFTRYQAIFIAFILNYTAYFAEIIRGGINTIDIGQYEATKVLGMSKSFAFIRIILPQVIKNTIPPLGNEIITLLKDTSLVYILGATDILKAAKSVSNTYSTFTPYIFVGFVYLGIIAIMTNILSNIERRFDYYR
ncbi:MAG TPA: amino acid ABC transporter permease [Soehngenia sp.]|nr:amino acid ABC transporter permease [Soehngenia sp.]